MLRDISKLYSSMFRNKNCIVLQFSNLCGTVYKRGNILFSSHGDRIVSPVGNRVTVFDLKR